jgi:glyoxylase-like metal-dependent hydrolase (beta-lactamase superfamily II)
MFLRELQRLICALAGAIVVAAVPSDGRTGSMHVFIPPGGDPAFGMEIPASTGDSTGQDTIPAALLRIDISEDMYARVARKGVIVITHAFPWPGNSLIVEMADSSLVLVDTPYTPEATRDLLEWVKSRFGANPAAAINTGYHYDNLGGNSCLIDLGIPVYGSRLTARLLNERGDAMRETTLGWLRGSKHRRYYEAHEKLPYEPPTHLFDLDEGLELEFGGEAVQAYYPGRSHSPDNVVVYFPGRKVLFGGCMVLGWDGVGNISDADMEAWPESIRRLSRFDADLIVPGHGERLDRGLLKHTIELLTKHPE